jgi:hypothetical protein
MDDITRKVIISDGKYFWQESPFLTGLLYGLGIKVDDRQTLFQFGTEWKKMRQLLGPDPPEPSTTAAPGKTKGLL